MKIKSVTLLGFALILLTTSFVFSCSAPATSAPQNLIPGDKFVDVLTDVRLLEASYGTRVGRPDTIGKYMDTYYKMLFDKHGVLKDQFYSSYEYYLKDHENMLLMEDKVLEKLTLLQAENDKRIPTEIRNKKDSTEVIAINDSLIGNKPPSAQSPSKQE
ncbi:MAG: DUF4296 domain-containing protein [Flavobacteriales bacterium]